MKFSVAVLLFVCVLQRTANFAAGQVLTVHTSTQYKYQFQRSRGLAFAIDQKSVTFRVRACNDAHLALSKTPNVDTSDTYEVVIGGWSNTKSVIRDCKQCANKASSNAPSSPLKCNQYRAFWVSWTNNVISVGTGNTVGQYRFMSWTDPSPHAVADVGVSTGWGSTGVWELDQDYDLGVHTPNRYHYQYLHNSGLDVTTRKYVTFNVKACNDAHVALSQYNNVDTAHTYEIVIGGWANRQSVIRDCKQCRHETYSRSPSTPLNCGQFRPFWASWLDDVVRVGTGSEVGKNQFMAWTDPHPHPVHYLAVSTGWGATGEWHFDTTHVVTEQTSLRYQYIYLQNQGVDVTHQSFVTFRVRACNDAHVALSAVNGVDTSNTYEVVIGGWSNTRSAIRECKQCTNRAFVSTPPNPLSCILFRPFWISWHSDDIRVGTGNTVGQNQFMSWKDPTPHKVKYIAVSTGWGAVGSWKVDKAVASVLDQYTPNLYKYVYLHSKGLDVTIQKYITFRVQACNDAHVALSDINGVDTRDTYEIVIGGWGNSRSTIRDCKQCTNLATVVSRPLDCNQFRPFWISWMSGTIRVGIGNTVGSNLIMAWHDPHPHPVNYLAVSTGFGATGKWSFDLEAFRF